MKIDTSEIIELITPLYNQYTLHKEKLSGTEALVIMWEIGKILSKYINLYNVAPHNLYRMIYGKSEGKTNIEQKSYISREFLGRTYRIYKMFKNTEEIKKTFPSLISFTAFREAMPFLDNEKFKLNGEDRDSLLKLLNSKATTKQINQTLLKLKSKYIGIKNPRTQRLKEVEPLRDIFLKHYNKVIKYLKDSDYEIFQSDFNNVDGQLFRQLSKIYGALVSEDSIIPEIKISENDPSMVIELKKLALELQKDIKVRRRFVRLVSTAVISRFADYLFALHSKESFLNFCTRLK